MKMRFALAGLAIFALYAVFLGRHGVLQQTEARYAEIAREMTISHDFIMPTLNGVPHVSKPPVAYWVTSGSMMLFGKNEIGARVAPLMAGFGVLLLTMWIGTLWFDRKVGIMALLLLAGSIEFYILSRSLCADMIMTFWSTAAIAAFAYVTCRIKRPTKLHFMPFFALMGIAFSTKGPMGIVVPLCTALAYQLNARKKDYHCPRVPWLQGMLLTLGLSVAWFVVVSLQHPVLWGHFLRYELIDRFFTKVHGRSEPFWYFIPVLLGGWLPWTPLIIPVLSKSSRMIWSGSAKYAIAGWIVVPLIILSFSGSKLSTYILPLLPGVALWFASNLTCAERTRSQTTAAVIQMIFFLAIGSAVSVALLSKSILPATCTTDVWFFPLWVLAIAVATGASWQMRKGITVQRLLVSSLASLLVFAALSSQIKGLAPALGNGVSLKPLAERIRREHDWKQAQVIVAGVRGHGMEFYLHHFVDSTRKQADVVLPLTPDIAKRIHPSVHNISFATNGIPVFVVTKKNKLKNGEFPAPEWTVLQSQGNFVLLRRKNADQTKICK